MFFHCYLLLRKIRIIFPKIRNPKKTDKFFLYIYYHIIQIRVIELIDSKKK